MTRRFVFDTGVLISAALMPRSIPRRALDAALATGLLAVSSATLVELTEVIHRDKFDQYASLSLRQAFVDQLAVEAELIDVTEDVHACRDPKDDIFLSLALTIKADCIITGDDDLLVLHPFRGVPILTPREFLDQIKPTA